MSLYNSKDEKLENIKEIQFKLEKDIQVLCEKNIDSLLQLKYIRSEFSIDNFRIDSLAYDEKNRAFVIIEYKRDKNFSVIDQGYAYLALMLNHKADFILEYNETTIKGLKRTDVDWSQSKVIFISPSFTNYQKEAISFKDLPIELWEIKKYSNNTISFIQIQTKGKVESINMISKTDKTIETVNKEIKVYTENEKLESANEEIKELYEKVKVMIQNIGDDITVKATKTYMAFIRNTNICDIEIQKSQLKMWLNIKYGKLEDSKNVVRNVSEIGHHGNGDYEISLSNDDDIEYIISLVRQVYNQNN